MLRFNSEEERQAHPQAGLIPLALWEGCFDKCLYPEALSLMKAPPDKLSLTLRSLKSRSNYQYHSISYWLSIIISHPNLSPKDFIESGTELHPDHQADLLAVANYLIQKDDREINKFLGMLFSTPIIRAVAANDENALLRLTLANKNAIAAECLFDIPAVKELAAKNEYYRNEFKNTEDDINLSKLANNSESSMKNLTKSEEERLEAAISHYQPIIKEKGLGNIIQAFRDRIVDRYRSNPATITLKRFGFNWKVKLPLSKIEFEFMLFKGDERDAALEILYKDPHRAASSYLSDFNLWGKNSSYNTYKSLIAMLYLAAIDPAFPPLNNQSIEDRLTHLIEELALIHRAHNWDNYRVKLNREGNIVRDKNDRPILEQYDDLKPDDSSCVWGIKRRLFQAVPDHPLLFILTNDTIEQELNHFVRDQFSKHINQNNIKQIKEGIRIVIEEIEFNSKDVAPLKALDISLELQQQFIDSLSQKYGDKFDRDFHLKLLIHDRFDLSLRGVMPESLNSHFSKFYESANLSGLFIAPETMESKTAQAILEQLLSYRNHLIKAIEENKNDNKVSQKKNTTDGLIQSLFVCFGFINAGEINFSELTGEEMTNKLNQCQNEDFRPASEKRSAMINFKTDFENKDTQNILTAHRDMHWPLVFRWIAKLFSAMGLTHVSGKSHVKSIHGFFEKVCGDKAEQKIAAPRVTS